TKLWSVYVSEAERRNKSLADSWMRDMKGVLLFQSLIHLQAALFSAILTAFIIESYKTLKPDTSDTIVSLLAAISTQLSTPVNGSVTIAVSSTPTPPSLSFAPTRAALICNTLWFTSLFLSLTCALLATLVEQWARGFTQKIHHRLEPTVQARIFSYLYYGLKQFNLHALVDLIPLLLHASLVLFLAGFIAFLIPVHFALVALAAGALVVVLTACGFLTIL
ncbi:hypothetical protein C8J57DRAFT_988841, partial [Mycena rebaudengoi]